MTCFLNRAFFVAFWLCTALFAQAQPDTLRGEGTFFFHHNGNPLENVIVDYKPLSMQDSLVPAQYSDTTDVNGEINYDVITGVDYHIGLDEHLLERITVAGNPGPDLGIHMAEIAPRYHARVINLQGQTVQTHDFAEQNTYYDLSHLPNAPYIIQVFDDKQEVFTTKVIKTEGMTRGPFFLQPKPKTAQSYSANYELVVNPGEGYVRDTIEQNISEGFNGVNSYPVAAWDTAFANPDKIVTYDGGSIPNKAEFVPLTIENIAMQDILIPDTEQLTSDINGNAFYNSRIVSVDTLGQNNQSPATIRVSWDATPNPNIDSNSVTGVGGGDSFLGWSAGDTTYTINPGNNSDFFAFLDRVPMPNIIGKEYVEFHVGQFDRFHNRTLADNALIVVYNQTQNTTDSIYTNATGTALYLANHNDQLFVGAGYHGAVGTNGEAIQNVRGLPITGEGVTLNRLAAGDTTQYVAFNLLPDTVAVNGTEVAITALEREMMNEKPSIMTTLDTIYYHVNQTVNGGFNNPEEINIDFILDSASTIFPVSFVKSSTMLPNTGYSPSTLSNTTHGINIFKGTNNITNIQTIATPPNTIGQATAYLVADVNIDATTNTTWKETLYQFFAFNGVPASYRLSVTNGNPAAPTNWDFANFVTKWHFDRELFRGYTSNVSGVPTQTISVDYYTDDTNILPQ